MKTLGGHTPQPVDSSNYLFSALKYLGVGLITGFRGGGLAKLVFYGSTAEIALGFTLEEALQEAARLDQEKLLEQKRQDQEKDFQELIKTIQQNMSASVDQACAEFKMRFESAIIPLASKPPSVEKDTGWTKTIIHPSVVLVLGKRGSGKSALGYRLLELFRYQLTPHILGIPAKAQKLLPDWIGVAQDLDDIPDNSIVLIDEAYLSYHSRESFKTQSKEISRIVNLTRQKNQTLIFVTQEARQIDKNITSQANVVIFKQPAILQSKFERPELNDIAVRAQRAFSDLSGDKREWAYVYSPDADFIGLMESALPTFWSTELSHAFAASGPTSNTRLPKNVTKEEKKAKAKELHKSGFSYRQIANMLNINESTAFNYVNDYPYKR